MKHFYIFLLILLLYSCSNRSSNHKALGLIDSDMEMSFEEEIIPITRQEEARPNMNLQEIPIGNQESKTWMRSNKVNNTTSLFIGDNEELPLKGMQIAISVDGFRARVLMDCFYYSDKEIELEGTFKMKLPQGATPFYFAFGESVYLDKSKKEDIIPFINYQEIDISTDRIEEMRSEAWSKPKVAKVVPKEKAAFEYGQTVKRQIDPALAEWAGADVYNCSVFPISSNKLHRIVIGYDVNLSNLKDDWILNFSVPDIKCPLILDFAITEISGVKCLTVPQQNSHSKNGKMAFRLTNPKEKEIIIRYQTMSNLVLKSPKENTTESYFATFISPNLPSLSNTYISNNAIIVLDISLSSNPDKFNVWLKLIEALLMNNRNSIKHFNVLLFNIETFWWKNHLIENTPENIAEFLKYANQVALEGASDIGLALSQIFNNKDLKKSSDNIFLLSDGADTWGESGNFEISKHINQNDILFAFNTGMSGTNISKLNHLAKISGGGLFSVTGEDEIQKASTAFKSKAWKIDNIEISGATDILIAGSPEYIYPGQKLLIVGRGSLEKNPKIQLLVSQGNLNKNITLRLNQSIESNLTSRIYGQIATDILEEFDYSTENKSIAYAKHFRIPGKTCSLLMLDTEEDYEEYDITTTEDAFVVKSTSVNHIIDDVLKDIEGMLGNDKIRFESWLDKLLKTDGVEFDINASFDLIMDRIPESSFTVKQIGLECKTRLKQDVPKNVKDSLLSDRLDYDLIYQEAHRRLTESSSHDALKILSSLVEKNPGDGTLARDVAFSALDWGLYEQAYYLFKRVLDSRPYEPQTYLAIAKTLAKIGNYELSLIYYEIAITAKWNESFGEFRRIATLDYLNFLGQIKDENSFILNDYALSRYKTLRSEFKEEYADLMVIISWNTDNTDVDLHIVEPTGEECYYQNRETKIGGYMTQDVTQGYGPEMYLIQDAKNGVYEIKVKYFSSNRNRTSTRTKIFATIYKNWGKKSETIINKAVTLEENKEIHHILTVDIN